MGYCKKHNQEYMDHVLECPICVGERMIIQKPKKFKRRKKRGKNAIRQRGN